MIWLLFKNCGKKKKGKTLKSEENNAQVNNSKTIIKELLPKLDVFDELDACDDDVFVTDKHFAYLSLVDPYNEYKEYTPGITVADRVVVESDISVENEVGDLEDGTEDTLNVYNRHSKVTQASLKSLQCPFTWDFEPKMWNKNVVNRIEKKYGKYNMNIPSYRFSFEKYISNLITSCGLFKTNGVDKAHDRLINIWEWLDTLDDKNELSYLAIRDGLKHIVMSTLCHILFTVNRMQCQQLFERITRFNSLDSKSRAAVNAIHAAVCIDIGGRALQNVVEYAKTACELDPDTVQWNYFLSLAMTAQRQHLNTNVSCPTAAEFDSIQQAIILSNEPNPYFNFHRMHLMTNKILYHCHLNYNKSESNGNENELEKIKKDFLNIIELIKAIVSMEPEDPHLVVKCAKALMTLPYLTPDDIFLTKQIISMAVNMGFHDLTVIRAIQKSLEIFRKLVYTYKEMNEKKMDLKSTSTQNPVKVKDDDLESDLKLIIDKYEQGSKPVLDLINLFEEYEGNSRWEIMSQICSYTILFKESSNLLISVEQFMMLINDKNIANSDIITKHRSMFIKDRSKEFNLAELVCNEIKLAIIFGRIKTQDQTQLYLDQLTKIVDVCQLKSKKVNPTFVSDLIGCSENGNQSNAPKPIDTVNQPNDLQQDTKHIVSKNSTKGRRLKHTSNNHYTRVVKSKPRRRHYRNE